MCPARSFRSAVCNQPASSARGCRTSYPSSHRADRRSGLPNHPRCNSRSSPSQFLDRIVLRLQTPMTVIRHRHILIRRAACRSGVLPCPRDLIASVECLNCRCVRRRAVKRFISAAPGFHLFDPSYRQPFQIFHMFSFPESNSKPMISPISVICFDSRHSTPS